MWKWLARRRQHRVASSAPPAPDDIALARSVLFAVFARYGDSVIAFKLIRSFVDAHPGKEYLLITTPQALHYAQALLGERIRCIGFDKHRDLIGLLRLRWLLRRKRFSLGFNPWSHGKESEYFISHAERFFPYGAFSHAAGFTRVSNLYDRARRYLGLPAPARRPTPELPAYARHIVLSPFSTDVRKSLGRDQVAPLLKRLGARFPQAKITLALFPHELGRLDGVEVSRFLFGKSSARSRAFLALLQTADLFIGVDAGPLHLADALRIPSIGLFGPTAPETILDVDSGIVPLRLKKMRGWFCDNRECHNPVCLQHLLATHSLEPAELDIATAPALEVETCRAR
jgi:hypothetical protein